MENALSLSLCSLAKPSWKGAKSFQYGSHTGIDSLMLQLELDPAQVDGSNKEDRCNELFRYLRDHPDEEVDGRKRILLVVEAAVRQALSNRFRLDRGMDAPLFRALD